MDAFDKNNPLGLYHGKLVKLYAVFARDKLLPFLRRSDHYPIQEALDICQREKYYPEMVYLLGNSLNLFIRVLLGVYYVFRTYW